jgi:3-hydroxy-9,10-secoandrosta-1,3,5(10)-triene-9,17-dione monooxygenase reductase component
VRKTGGIILFDLLAAPTPDQFRDAMAQLPTGVTIVSATGAEGPAGATANAVTSLSLDPPLMLACLDRGSRTLTRVREAGRFGISVLAADQAELARGFATKAPHSEKFRDVSHVERAGVPLIDGAVAWIACRLRSLHDGGDHEIAVGEVLDLGGDGGDPLVFFGGAYRPLDRPTSPRSGS